MFSFFKRTPKTGKIAPVFSFVGTDIHSHLLPGIDDGSPDPATSILLVEGLRELGFESFVCTPHVLGSVHPNTPESIASAKATLKDALAEAGHDIELHASAEYMTDYEFNDIIEAAQLVPMPGDYVLIEMSYAIESPNLREVIFSLQTKGFRPILAHPERYPYLFSRFSQYEEIVDAGADLQINLLSLQGYYGKPIQKVAEKLIAQNLISWVGTDMHHTRHLEAMRQLARNAKALSYLDKIKNLKNPTLLQATH